jgi:hypothetical protein
MAELLAVTKILHEVAKLPVAQKAMKSMKVSFDVFWSRMFKSYYEKYCKYLSETKTLIYRHESVDLKDIYIASRFELLDKPYSEKDILEAISDNKRIVISGIAGSGKSIFLRHLFISFPLATVDKIPLFLQLRNIKKEQSVLDALYTELQLFEARATPEHLRLALEGGAICLMLDGFDEIDPERRQEVEVEILQLSKQYPSVPIIITGRPDQKFESWSQFTIYKVASLVKSDVVELADKIKINREKIDQFKTDVQSGLFESHEQFMSNPLLVTMLLLVYCEGNSIPDQAHLFYERAYDVLSLQHDGLKDLYTRRFHSRLSPEQIRKLLEVYSVSTYEDSAYSVPSELVRSYIDRSKKYLGFEADTGKVIKDLCESISILFVEARYYHYLHRSFQEYFVAYFLLHRIPDRAETYFREFFYKPISQHCVELAFQMNERFMVHSVVKPWVNSVYSDIKDLDPKTDTKEFLRKFFYSWERDHLFDFDEKHRRKSYRMAAGEDTASHGFALLVACSYNDVIRARYAGSYHCKVSLSLPNPQRKRSNITQAFIDQHPELVDFCERTKQMLHKFAVDINKDVERDLRILRP